MRSVSGRLLRHGFVFALAAILTALPQPLTGQEAGTDSAEAAPAVDTTRLPALRATVRRTLFDPGLARSVERLEPGEGVVPFRDLADWLESRTSVGVRSFGGGGRQVLSVRGGRPEGVLVLLDGLPINDPLTGEADLSGVPLESLSSATLVRGAGTARYGSGALGGALLLESASGNRGKPEARIGLGSYGAYEMSASAGRDGDVDLRIGAGLRGAENDFSYENRLAHGTPERERTNADSESHWVELSAETDAIHGTMRYDRLERGVPGRLGTSVFEGDRWREARWSASASVGGERATGRIGLRRLTMRYAPGGSDGTGGSDGPTGDSAEPSSQRALDFRAGGEVALPEFGDLVIAGRASLERLEGDGIDGDPDRSAAGATVRRAFRSGPGDSGFGVEPLIGVDVSGDGSALSPEIGAWYRPDPSTRFYGRVGRGYRLPTFADLHFEAAPGVRAHAELDPERVVLDAELGMEASRSLGWAGASVKLAAWTRDTRDPIVWLASSVAVWSPRNLDRLVARGMELEARVGSPVSRRDAGGRKRGLGWAVEAGVTLQDSRVGFGSNRNPLPYQPDVIASASVELERRETALRLDATYTGSRTTSVAATRRLDGFLTVDLGLRRRLTPGPFDIVASLDVTNLFDRRYELVELFPEPGRSLRLTIDIHPNDTRHADIQED